MEIDKVIKTTVTAVIAAGFLVLIAKHGSELGKFLDGSAQALVGLGKGIGSIG